MPRVRMTAQLKKPSDKKFSVFETDNPNLDVYFNSSGEWDYLCGNCNKILVRGFGLNQLQGNAVFKCPKCNHYNFSDGI